MYMLTNTHVKGASVNYHIGIRCERKSVFTDGRSSLSLGVHMVGDTLKITGDDVG